MPDDAKEKLRQYYQRRYANRLDQIGEHADTVRARQIEAFYRRQRNGARAAKDMEKEK